MHTKIYLCTLDVCVCFNPSYRAYIHIYVYVCMYIFLFIDFDKGSYV